MGPISTAPPGTTIYQCQDSNLTPRSYAIDSHTYLLPTGVHTQIEWDARPKLTHRLHGGNDLSSQLSVKHAFNMTRGRIAYRSLTGHTQDLHTLLLHYRIPARSPFIIITWLFP